MLAYALSVSGARPYSCVDVSMPVHLKLTLNKPALLVPVVYYIAVGVDIEPR